MTLRLQFKGFNYVDYYRGEYSDNNSLDGVVKTGSNGVALTPDWGIDIADSKIYAGGATTDTLANLRLAVDEANDVGLTSMVRPLVDILYNQKSSATPNFYYVPGAGYTARQNIPQGVTPAKVPRGADTTSFRGFIDPADLDITKFFGSPTTVGSYDYMIVQEAKVAQAAGAKLFAVGTELDSLATDKDPTVAHAWTTLIADVRKVFKGSLTYSANWYNADKVTFWKKLDYVGIDGYVPLSNVVPDEASQNPSLSSLVAGWTKVSKVKLPYSNETVGQALHGLSAIDYFDKLAASSISKKFIFTEIGYQNDTAAAFDPTGSSHSGVTDPSLQASLYQAFFKAWQSAQDTADGNGGKLHGYNYALAGVYMWDWNPDISKSGYDDWSTRGYPANSVITSNYSGASSRQIGTEARQTSQAARADIDRESHGGDDDPVGSLGGKRGSGGFGSAHFVYHAARNGVVEPAIDRMRVMHGAAHEPFRFTDHADFSHDAGQMHAAFDPRHAISAADTSGTPMIHLAATAGGRMGSTQGAFVF